MMRLCRACLKKKSESEFYRRGDNGKLRHKCAECEKEKRPLRIRIRTHAISIADLKEKEKERFFVCNIKWCTRHKVYHPLTAFGLRSDVKWKYRSACKEHRNELRRKRVRKSNKAMDKRYQSGMTKGEQIIQRFICGERR